MRKCAGCESPKDDRRWMSIDGTSLCEECLDKESAVDEIALITAERDDYKRALDAKYGAYADLIIQTQLATARRCVEICNKIWDYADPESEAECAVEDCIAAIRTEFAITGVLQGGGK